MQEQSPHELFAQRWDIAPGVVMRPPERSLTFLKQREPQTHREEEVHLVDPYFEEAAKDLIPKADFERLQGYTRSYYTVEGHYETTMKYNQLVQKPPQEPEWQEVVKLWHAECTTTKIEIVNWDTCFRQRQVDFVSSSAYGFSHPGKKKGDEGMIGHALKHADTCVRIYDTNREKYGKELALAYYISNSLPDVPFTRTQLVESSRMKIRQVFGRDFGMFLIGAPYFQSLQKRLLATSFDTLGFIMAGYDQRVMVPQLLHEVCDGEHDGLVTDYSEWDARFQSFEQDLVNSGLRKMSAFPNQITENSSEVAMDQSKRGKMIDVKGGEWYRFGPIASGDAGTQIVGSCGCKNRTRFLLLKQGITPRAIFTLSDDNLSKISNQYKVDLNKFSEDAASYGWNIRPDKCGLSSRARDLELLGRRSYGMYNIRDYWKCMRLALNPEYSVESGDISTYRVKSLMEDAGIATGDFPKIFRYLKSKYGLASVESVGPHRSWYSRFSM
jgi:hypothetical protein